MESKKFTQPGTFSLAIMLPLFLLFLVLSIKAAATNGPELYGYSSVALCFLICILLFYKLTMTIDQESVSFKLGIGLVNKSYKLADIRDCRPVSNSIFYGIGIRLIPNGWLYNVSGLKAVELSFNNRKSVVRIGTDRPEEVSAVIGSLLDGRDDINI